MAVLGGDDAGGGVIWAPQVIEDAKDHGLVLSQKGKLYDTAQGQSLPAGDMPMPVLTPQELVAFPELSAQDLVPNHVARYWDMVAFADPAPAKIIGESAMLPDRPGFEVEFITQCTRFEDFETFDQADVIMPVRGHWRLQYEGGSTALNPGDTASVPEHMPHHLAPAMSGACAAFRIRKTADPAGPTWKGN